MDGGNGWNPDPDLDGVRKASRVGLRLLVNRLQPVSFRIDHESGVIGRAVLRPKARRAVIGPAGRPGRGVEAIHCLAARGVKGQMEPGAGRQGVRSQEQGEPVLLTGVAVDRTVVAGPDTRIAERGDVRSSKAPLLARLRRRDSPDRRIR